MIERDRRPFNSNVFVVKKEETGLFVAELGNGYKKHTLEDFDLNHLTLICTGEVHGETRNHTGSQMKYKLERYTQEGHKELLAFLPPNSHSSTHKHPDPIIEHYFILSGELHLFLGEDQREIYLEGNIDYPATFTVLPGVKHRVETREEPALMYILMENAARVPKYLQHIYPSI